jgi:GNAT superfamily N-acetyltransferase
MLQIENAADNPAALDQVGRWHWEAWGSVDPKGSLETWTESLKAKANRDRIPLTLLAYEDTRLVGAVSVIEHDMPDRTDLAPLTPWIAGTYVAAADRGRGIGSALMQQAECEAARLGIKRLYLYTSAAVAFYARLGWQPELQTEYEGDAVTVMSLEIS